MESVDKSWFETKGGNYIGTPYGTFHTNKPLSQVDMTDFLYCDRKGIKDASQYKYHYKVVAGDTLVAIEIHNEDYNERNYISKPISFVFNGQWLGLRD